MQSAKWQRRGIAALLVAVTAAVVCLPDTAAAGGRRGIELCLNVLLPALFPFLVLSDLAVQTGLAQRLGVLLEGVTRRLLRVPGACSAALVLGILGGYPVGATVTARLYEQCLCTRREAERLLAMCNNSGPAFIFGVVGAHLLGGAGAGALMYAIHLAASLIVCLLLRGRGRQDGARPAPPPVESVRFGKCLTASVRNGFASVLNICAFVIFFSVLLELTERLGLLAILAGPLRKLLEALGGDPSAAEPLVRGIFELSSGASSLAGVADPVWRMICASFLLGWAGVCVHFQTVSVVCDQGLSLGRYLLGKLLHGVIAASLTALVCRFTAVAAYNGTAQEAVGTLSLFFILDFGAAALVLTIAALSLRLVRRLRLKKRP